MRFIDQGSRGIAHGGEQRTFDLRLEQRSWTRSAGVVRRVLSNIRRSWPHPTQRKHAALKLWLAEGHCAAGSAPTKGAIRRQITGKSTRSDPFDINARNTAPKQ